MLQDQPHRKVLDRARRLAAEGREPQVTWRAAGDLDRVAGQLRWSREHRHHCG